MALFTLAFCFKKTNHKHLVVFDSDGLIHGQRRDEEVSGDVLSSGPILSKDAVFEDV